MCFIHHNIDNIWRIITHHVCVRYIKRVEPRDCSGFTKRFSHPNIPLPTRVHVRKHTHGGEKPTEPVQRTLIMETWLALHHKDAIRQWVNLSKWCIFGDSQVSICKPGLAWSFSSPSGDVAERWAIWFAGRKLGAATWKLRMREMPEGGSHGSSWLESVIIPFWFEPLGEYHCFV